MIFYLFIPKESRKKRTNILSKYLIRNTVSKYFKSTVACFKSTADLSFFRMSRVATRWGIRYNEFLNTKYEAYTGVDAHP